MMAGLGGTGTTNDQPTAAPGRSPRRASPTSARGPSAWLLLVFGVVSIAVAGALLALVLIDRGGDHPGGMAAGVGATDVSPASTSSVAASRSAPSNTMPPTTPTIDPMSQAQVAAGTTVDHYLVVASGRDEHAFAAMWSYPIDDHYGERGVDEVHLRASARAYWSRYPSMQFRRSGPTTVTRSSEGWETSTNYIFDGVGRDGARKCGATTLRLSFTDHWLVRAASEGTPTPGC